MLRDNLVGPIEQMLCSAGDNPLALSNQDNKPSDDRPPCFENRRPKGAESTLTENASSPFQAEPRHPEALPESEHTLGQRKYAVGSMKRSVVFCSSRLLA